MKNKNAFKKKVVNNLQQHEISILELKYTAKENTLLSPIITSPLMSSAHFKLIWNADTINLYEEFKVMLLTAGNSLIGISTIAKGGKRSLQISINFIIAIAILSNADKIIIAHNHPSGALFPSPADRQLTEKIFKICALFDIILADHIIITNAGYYSFCQEGLLTLSPHTTTN